MQRPTAPTGIVDFLSRVERRVDAAIAGQGFDAGQTALLNATVAHHRVRTRGNPFGDPLALFYLIARAERAELDAQGEELAVFSQFYLLALDLLDDVQDNDLAGKPLAEAGPALAINNGLTLLFLAMAALERAMACEPDAKRALAYLSLVNRVALVTGRGQHRDLVGSPGTYTPDQVLELQKDKTASLALLCECAALYATRDQSAVEGYRRVGENLSLMVQIVDDVRDIYGKSVSPDLAGQTPTYPLACFLEQAAADQVADFQRLRAELPTSIRDLRAFLYESGTVRTVAQTIERFRREIHREIASRGADPTRPTPASATAARRTFLSVIDSLAGTIYAPKPVEESQRLFAPTTPWHAKVRALAVDFRQRMGDWDAPPTPPLIPWHMGHWMYDPERNVIYYPDLEGMPEETLAMQAELLGETDIARLGTLVEAQAPAVLAHELFHHFRDVVGRLSEDRWHEELAANTLALAYCREFEPQALAGGLALARRVLVRPENSLSDPARAMVGELLSRGSGDSTAHREYGFGMYEMALVQLALIEGLAQRQEPLGGAASAWLRPPRATQPLQAAL
jgi:geranylgeranyl pyrophosphate synthase